MKKNNERTFGTRLADAFNLADVLAGFTNYKAPRDLESLLEYRKLIASIQGSNNDSAVSKQVLSMATEARQQLFYKHNNSIRNLLGPINAAINAQYGFSSKEAADVKSKTRALLGQRAVKLEKVTGNEPISKPKKISTSHMAAGSLTQTFSDMIAVLGEMLPAYNPANPDLSVLSLKAKHTQLMSINSKLAISYAAWKKARAERDSQYEDLKDRTKRIKNSVKSQYGGKSTEYNSIKSFKV